MKSALPHEVVQRAIEAPSKRASLHRRRKRPARYWREAHRGRTSLATGLYDTCARNTVEHHSTLSATTNLLTEPYRAQVLAP